MNSEPLWSDEQVSKEAVEATDELDGSVYVHHVILQLLLKMRADYEAQLAEARNKCNCNCPSCSYCDNKLGG